MRIASTFLATLTGVILLATLGCGKSTVQSGPGPGPGPLPPSNGHARLIVFGAGYCTICKARFPEIQQQLDKLSAADQAKISVDLILVAGDPASVRPTDEMAVEYAEHRGLKASARADAWRWQTFRQMIGSHLEVPAAVVLDINGKVQRVFTAGDTTFVPQEIVAVAQDVAHQGGVR